MVAAALVRMKCLGRDDVFGLTHLGHFSTCPILNIFLVRSGISNKPEDEWKNITKTLLS